MSHNEVCVALCVFYPLCEGYRAHSRGGGTLKTDSGTPNRRHQQLKGGEVGGAAECFVPSLTNFLQQLVVTGGVNLVHCQCEGVFGEHPTGLMKYFGCLQVPRSYVLHSYNGGHVHGGLHAWTRRPTW